MSQQQNDLNNGRGAGEPRPTQAQPKTPEQLREEIARTRSALSNDVAALGDKLNPETLKENAREMIHEAKDAAKEGAKEMFRDAKDAAIGSMRQAKDQAVETISETVHVLGQRAQDMGSSTASFVSAHAVPLSLVGLGVGWLMLSLSNGRRSRARGDSYGYYDRELGLEPEHGLGERARGAVSAARERVGEVASRASHTLSDKSEQLRERAGEVGSQLVRRASDARERASELGHRAYEGIGRASERARDFGEENPLAIGLIALAAGVGVGLLLPATRRENRLMGETRDRLAENARRTISELGHSVERGAGELRGALSER
jgi:ElaB/YqjD/DUF883 family membrane-anchored ribosome-binding protein